MEIKILDDAKEIELCFDTLLELRPHLNNKHDFINQVLLQKKEGYQIAAIMEENEIIACIGYRIMTMLVSGKILYIDDLVTKINHQRKGYANALLKYAISFAKDHECNQVHLDSGYTRYSAHKVYLNHGFQLHCHHFALKLK